ncbi:hypothetical protein DUNSADRAFT_14967 [Dunaliella salina]|uniref:Secreted protein n=1 Tax=Dunaliella salina TaxID=3046 RepID=A0ABQ7G6B1_DUNSA|nr:hypothetical protein DUNSADRAFT_14967 [Dunaliella salina]|eukprot:KAF5830149.1 hypothetical protein DUNSADRAFT_14967 [Dunaliella salina]
MEVAKFAGACIAVSMAITGQQCGQPCLTSLHPQRCCGRTCVRAAECTHHGWCIRVGCCRVGVLTMLVCLCCLCNGGKGSRMTLRASI